VLKHTTASFTLLINQVLLCAEHIKGHARGCDCGTLVLITSSVKIIHAAVQSLRQLVESV
jgi:hypothetical protein